MSQKLRLLSGPQDVLSHITHLHHVVTEKRKKDVKFKNLMILWCDIKLLISLLTQKISYLPCRNEAPGLFEECKTKLHPRKSEKNILWAREKRNAIFALYTDKIPTNNVGLSVTVLSEFISAVWIFRDDTTTQFWANSKHLKHETTINFLSNPAKSVLMVEHWRLLEKHIYLI